jgi:hypothetical protein
MRNIPPVQRPRKVATPSATTPSPSACAPAPPSSKAKTSRYYYQLYNELDAEWKPQTRTERCYLETMVASQWLLARVARSEQRVYMEVGFGERQFALLAQVDKQRAHLERSFRTAIADMKQAQKERQARQPQPAPTAHSAKSAPAPVPQPAGSQAPPPDYVMSEAAEAHPVFCAPVTPDSR